MQNKNKKTTAKNQRTKNVQKNNTVSNQAMSLIIRLTAERVSNDLQARHIFESCLKETGDNVHLKEKVRTIPVSVLKNIFKDFAKEQFETNNELAVKYSTGSFREESLELYKESFKQNKMDISSGKTEKLLKHLGIIKDGIVNVDNLETAIKTLSLLFIFCENHDDRVFLLPGLEIQFDQIRRLHRIARGL